MTGRQEFGVHMSLHHTTLNDLPFLCEIEQRFAKLGFVHSDDLCAHQQQMNDPDNAYYTVEQGENSPAMSFCAACLPSIILLI